MSAIAEQDAWEIWPVEELERLMAKSGDHDQNPDLSQGWWSQLFRIVIQLLEHFANLPEALSAFARNLYAYLAGLPARGHSAKPATLNQALENLGVVVEEFDVHASSNQKGDQ